MAWFLLMLPIRRLCYDGIMKNDVRITYKVGDIRGEISWAVSEQFDELIGIIFSLGKVEAVDIEKMAELSLMAKLLLSAVAGAIIQRLIDNGISPKDIFSVGEFQIEEKK